MQQLYFRFKDQVFVGSRPYPSEPFEKFLMLEFGKDTKMTSIKYPRYASYGLLCYYSAKVQKNKMQKFLLSQCKNLLSNL